MFRRAELWASLRLLHGFDLPEFIEGARRAYGVASAAMYERDWGYLRPLVHEDCLGAMQGMAEDLAARAQRVQIPDVEESSAPAFNVLSAKLRRAQLLQPSSDGVEAGTWHLQVHYRVEERIVIYDYSTNEPIQPFDGAPRLQESTWLFEGVVVTESAEKGETERTWILRAFV